MSERALARLLAAWLAVTLGIVGVVHAALALAPRSTPRLLVDTWRAGRRVGRVVHDGDARFAAPPTPPGDTRVTAEVVAEGWLPAWPLALALLVVPERDGVEAAWRGRRAWLTVDELVAAGAYDTDGLFEGSPLPVGVDHGVVLARLAAELGTDARTLRTEGAFRRVRLARRDPAPKPRAPLDAAAAWEAVHGLATHLARGADGSGRFAYQVRAPTNQVATAYSVARHAGTTFFLAQAAPRLEDDAVTAAALRAAGWLRAEGLQACGVGTCAAQAEDDEVVLGASALALLAFAEIDLAGLDRSYRPAARELEATLRVAIAADGRVVPRVRRSSGAFRDVPTLYVAGQFAYALARASRAFAEPASADLAEQVLGALARETAGRPLASRWLVGEEHWTCLAAGELADLRPGSAAARAGLDLCARWLDVQLRMQLEEGETPFDADGAFSVSPFVTPRTTPAATRAEALGAFQAGAAASGWALPSDPGISSRDAAFDRTAAYLARRVLSLRVHGPLLEAPEAAAGAMPESASTWTLRIDYAQHAGSALLRWLDLRAAPGAAPVPLVPLVPQARTDSRRVRGEPWRGPATRLRFSLGGRRTSEHQPRDGAAFRSARAAHAS